MLKYGSHATSGTAGGRNDERLSSAAVTVICNASNAAQGRQTASGTTGFGEFAAATALAYNFKRKTTSCRTCFMIDSIGVSNGIFIRYHAEFQAPMPPLPQANQFRMTDRREFRVWGSAHRTSLYGKIVHMHDFSATNLNLSQSAQANSKQSLKRRTLARAPASGRVCGAVQ